MLLENFTSINFGESLKDNLKNFKDGTFKPYSFSIKAGN